jgi:mono/diheme cytochrome c family protein
MMGRPEPHRVRMKTFAVSSAINWACLFVACFCGCRSRTSPSGVVSVTVSPGTANVQTQMPQQFTAMVATSGPDVSQAVIWQASGDGTISPSGLFTAGTIGGNATITAVSAADTSAWGSATVNVTVPAAALSNSSSAQLAPIDIPSGQNLYRQYCAACHGIDAKGHGPAASSFKTPPTDLSTLAERNGGQFPYDYVSRILLLGPGVTAHGSIDMPTWGNAFLYLNGQQNNDTTQQRIKNLSDYLASLQQK